MGHFTIDLLPFAGLNNFLYVLPKRFSKKVYGSEVRHGNGAVTAIAFFSILETQYNNNSSKKTLIIKTPAYCSMGMHKAS